METIYSASCDRMMLAPTEMRYDIMCDIIMCLLFQLLDGDCIQPMHGPGYPMFPAIYRQFIYYLSSADALKKFSTDPLRYLKQPSPKPVVPIRMAIVGPPKSGKTSCK